MIAQSFALVLVLASLLAWDAFRRHLADRRDARAVQRQEGASTERLQAFETELWKQTGATGKELEFHWKRLDSVDAAHEARILSLERALNNPKAARR